MRKLFAVLILGLVVALPGHAQVGRLLPANGKLGQLGGEARQFPLVEINREVLRLAPGGVIVDTSNRFLLHQQLPGHANVLYVVDARGEVSRIVILTAAEVERLQQAARR